MIVGTPRGLSEITPERKLEITKLIDSISEQAFKAECEAFNDETLNELRALHEIWGDKGFSFYKMFTVYYTVIQLIINNIDSIEGVLLSSDHDKAVDELYDVFDGAFLYERLKSVASETDTVEDYDNLTSVMIAEALAQKQREIENQTDIKNSVRAENSQRQLLSQRRTIWKNRITIILICRQRRG